MVGDGGCVAGMGTALKFFYFLAVLFTITLGNYIYILSHSLVVAQGFSMV